MELLSERTLSRSSEKVVSKDELFDENSKFKKGHPKIGGRIAGTKNFETDFDEAVDEIAKENKMTRSEARKLLLKVAFKQAKDGNYSFYKDIHDRIYGQAKNFVEHSGEIQIPIYGGLSRHNGNKEDISTEKED